MSNHAEKGAWVLAEYAGTYYPGAEDTDDPDGAFTVGSDIIADILHRLHELGHPEPEHALTLASVHYVEESDEPERPECPECGTRVDIDGYCTDVGCVNVGKAVG